MEMRITSLWRMITLDGGAGGVTGAGVGRMGMLDMSICCDSQPVNAIPHTTRTPAAAVLKLIFNCTLPFRRRAARPHRQSQNPPLLRPGQKRLRRYGG